MEMGLCGPQRVLGGAAAWGVGSGCGRALRPQVNLAVRQLLQGAWAVPLPGHVASWRRAAPSQSQVPSVWVLTLAWEPAAHTY